MDTWLSCPLSSRGGAPLDNLMSSTIARDRLGALRAGAVLAGETQPGELPRTTVQRAWRRGESRRVRRPRAARRSGGDGEPGGDARMNWTLRPARLDDVPALEELIPLSVRALQAAYHSSAQMEAALGPVFGVDRQLITDGTYFVAEQAGQIIGCGGWSRRKALFGGDRARGGMDGLIDPASEPARIRAFFIHPKWARRGIGRAILAACESAIRAAGFRDAELVATLTGEPLYASAGFAMVERYDVPLAGGLTLPVVKMRKRLQPPI